MKRCSSCLREKPFDQFALKRRGGEIYQEWCKNCMRGYRYANREIERQQDYARFLKNRALKAAQSQIARDTGDRRGRVDTAECT